MEFVKFTGEKTDPPRTKSQKSGLFDPASTSSLFSVPDFEKYYHCFTASAKRVSKKTSDIHKQNQRS